MLHFSDDSFDFKPSEPGADKPTPVSDGWSDGFHGWQVPAVDFFSFLHHAEDGAQDFANAWHYATESFADQFAHWFGWNNDDSPV
jgi:hypothetical protein